MNPNFNPPLYSPPPAQSFGYSPADYGRNATANMPSSMTSIYSNSAVAELLLRNFAYFSSGAAFVTRDSLIDFANRPLVDGGYHDQMTLVARDILGRGDLPRLFDGIQNGGQEDGLINQEDVELAINQLAQQDARGYRSAGYNGAMQQPTGEFGARYTSAMQQQRVNQQFAPAFCEQPASNGPRGMEGWDALPPAPRAFGAQQPSYAQMPGSQRWDPIMAGDQTYANERNAHKFEQATDSELATALSANFDYFKPNVNDKITQATLREIAARPMTDNPEDNRMTLLAGEIISRPGLNRKLDSDHDADKPDGIIGRDTLERVLTQRSAPDYGKMDDLELLQSLKEKFKQLWESDSYISFSGLQNAAAESPPTDRSHLAAELLRRRGLMKELDIGTNNDGGRGYEDQRLDMDNVNYVIEEKQHAIR
jgi:hypothetical protein